MFGAALLVERSDWPHLAGLSGAIEDAGWDYAFCAEGPYAGNTSSIVGSTVLAENTSRVTVGTCISITYFRHAWEMAASAGNLAVHTDGRFLLGLGVSHPAINEPLGISMPKPISETRAYVGEIRNYWEQMGWEAPIWMAAVNEPMARLAGEVADGIIYHHVPLGMLPASIATVKEAAAAAGRPAPIVAAYARIAMTDDLGSARRMGRDITREFYRFPFYQKLYEQGAFGYEATRIRTALERGDDDAAYDLISNEFMDDYLVLGDARRCREQFERFYAAGVDVLLFAPLPIHGVPLVKKFRPLLEEFRQHPRSAREIQSFTTHGRTSAMPNGHDSKLGWPAKGRLGPTVKFALEDGRALAVAAPVYELETLLTPTNAFFAVQHFLPPEPIDPTDLTVKIRGRVDKKLDLSLDRIKELPNRTVRALIECSGNGQDDFPLSKDDERIGDPLFAAGIPSTGEAPERLLGHNEFFASAGEFTGASLSDVLELAGIRPGAVSIRVEGRDSGVPDPMLHGLPEELCDVDPFNYDKGLPMSKALDPDTILAWAMNGEPLAHLHGAPLRLLVPGWAGNWSVKWVHKIQVRDKKPKSWYQTQYYYYAKSLDDPDRRAITALPVKSLITRPASRVAEVERGRHVIRGLAWSGAAPVSRVDVSVDNGASWQRATIEEPRERWLWARWSLPYEFTQPGRYTLLARATDDVGRVQPRVPAWNILRKNFDGMIPVVLSVK
jgi:DMSO/TMAO reductase YedYZ molybdopterin-dependent catalytic subunit/alkanesulfonate monooxygenase SsuD/methylene tetrahydromethanopterin reductase-like flavin-dependent oxidoreductase (luciferase family)